MKREKTKAIHSIALSAKNGTWKPGATVLGLKEQGVGLAMDQHNAKLVSDETKKKLAAMEADIVSGKVKVATYTPEAGCKY